MFVMEEKQKLTMELIDNVKQTWEKYLIINVDENY